MDKVSRATTLLRGIINPSPLPSPLQTFESSHQHPGDPLLALCLKCVFFTWFSALKLKVCVEDPVLFSGTIASNIAYGSPDATRSEIEHAARQANCEFVWTMPDGFDTESKLYSALCLVSSRS
jgi:hypothetical protein